ncbi:MAG: lysophospholipid acyltransferase family protein [Nitrospira sp.]|nr:lysophospholipid acyltransferase family protein [Nitrospira sp.]
MSSAAGKRLERWVKLSVVPPVGAWVIRCLGRSMRIESQGHEAADQLYQAGTRAIFAFWHARQLLMPFAYRGERAHVLISQHQDGEIIARIVERFGFLAVRGSSTRGGVEALRELIRLGHSGADLVVTPDGPKGPAQVAKIGVIQLARATGLPIVPITAACSKKNSSRAGIGSCSPGLGRAGSFCGAGRSGCPARQARRSLKRSGWNWRSR